MLQKNLHAAALVAVFSTLAAAQTPVRLVGGAVSGAGPFLQNQLVCNQATSLCAPILAVPPLPFAGGTAYDPIRGVVWDSDGPSITAVTAPMTNVAPCLVRCPPQPVPGLPAGAVVTGLAFEEDGTATGGLWALDSAFGLQRYTWPNPRCPNQGPRCSIQNFMPTANHRAAGLAVSERHGLVFFSASDFSGGPANSWVFAAPLSNPCAPGCRLQITGCAGVPLGPITGLAFDDCRSMLYITDGRVVFFGVFAPAGVGVPCTLTAAGCCPQGVIGAYYGLDLETSHTQNAGSSCLTAPCPICAAMSLDTQGDAALGNPSFGYRLTGAPPGALAFCYFNVGACTPGVPILCGLLHLPLAPAPFLLGSAVTAGGACAATAFHPLPIPNSVALCGLPITAQDIVVCLAGTGFGTGLSNAVCAVLTDN